MLVSKINRHLAFDSVLACSRYGFCRKVLRNPVGQFVNDIISNLYGAVNRGHKQTDLLNMNYAKAFDKVILQTLDNYGVRGTTHE